MAIAAAATKELMTQRTPRVHQAELLSKRSADHTFRMREEPFSVAFQEV